MTRTVIGCSDYQQDAIHAFLARNGILVAERSTDGTRWMTDGAPATRGEASALTKLAGRFGYNLHRGGRPNLAGTGRIRWERLAHVA